MKARITHLTTAIKVVALVAALFATTSARAQDFTDHFWPINSSSLFARGQMEVMENSVPFGGRATKSIYADGRGSISVEVYLGEELVGEASVDMTDQEGVDPDPVKVLTILMLPEVGPFPASSTFQDGVLSIQFGTDKTGELEYQQYLRVVVSVRGNVDLATISTAGDAQFSGRGMGEATIDYEVDISLPPL